LTFASEKLSFDDLFPIEVRFDETYSMIDLNALTATNAANGEPLSIKVL
jgi:hypothetical protein